MKIVLLRHAECVANVDKVFAGNEPTGLTSKGRSSIPPLAEELGEIYDFTHIYSSSLARARRTSRILLRHLDLGLGLVDRTFDDRLRERNYGPFSGMKISTVAQDKRVDFSAIEGVEKPSELLERTGSFLAATIRSSEAGDTALAVTHGSNLKIVRALLDDSPIDTYYKTPSVGNLEYDEYDVSLLDDEKFISIANQEGQTATLELAN